MDNQYYMPCMQLVTEGIVEWRKGKGFETPSNFRETHAVLAKVALCHEELGEATSAARHGDDENFAEEMADCCIRIMDLCGSLGIDLARAIADKMMVNEGRPERHGKLA